MNTLHDLLGKSAPKKGAADTSAQGFFELDLEKIKRDLSLIKEGRERGEKNLPASNSKVMDDVEHKIIATIESEQRQRQQALNEQLGIQQQRIARLDLEHEAINIASAAQRASSEFRVKVDDGKAKLFTLWRNVIMIEKQWNDFRAKHRLSHPADYPLSRLWNFAIILVILAIESILNGNFLARGLETGLIGGIFEAFIIAAINVSFGFFFGDSVVRFTFHRNLFLRGLAIIEIPITCTLAIAFNLLVGHYRDALSGVDPMHASNAALSTFLTHPFSLGALESWALFGLGIFFWSVAAADGFKMDDSYPGYGKISRKHEEIILEYTNEKTNIIHDLSHTRDQALTYIHEARQNLAGRRSELSGILDQRDKLMSIFEAQQNYLNRAVNDLLSTYRNANMRARTAPPPKHFNDTYTASNAVQLVSLPHAAHDKSQNGNIDKTDEALQHAVNQVNAQFELAIKEFHEIAELTRGNEHAAPPAQA